MIGQKGSILLFLLIVQILLEQVYTSPQLFDWLEDRGRRRRGSPTFSDEEEQLSNSIEEPAKTSSALNIGKKDSPYALIHEYFPRRENEHQRRKNLYAIHHAQGLVEEPPKGLNPEDIWLSEGNLLVLKGGTADDTASLEEDWEPIDNYQAPYREPKLPPPDFIPNDIGVGVPLEEEENEQQKSVEKKKLYVTPPPHFAPTPRTETPKDNEIKVLSKRQKLKKLLLSRSFRKRQPRVLDRSRDRYVSFFRGSTGNSRSWSYSYNL